MRSCSRRLLGNRRRNWSSIKTFPLERAEVSCWVAEPNKQLFLRWDTMKMENGPVANSAAKGLIGLVALQVFLCAAVAVLQNLLDGFIDPGPIQSAIWGVLIGLIVVGIAGTLWLALAAPRLAMQWALPATAAVPTEGGLPSENGDAMAVAAVSKVLSLKRFLYAIVAVLGLMWALLANMVLGDPLQVMERITNFFVDLWL